MDRKNNRPLDRQGNAHFLGENLIGCILPIAVAE